MLHTADGEEPKKEEEELNKLVTTVEEKLKKVTITEEGEKLKINNVTSAEGEEEELKKVKLKTSDNVIFEMEPFIAKEMEMVQFFIDAHGGDVVVPLHRGVDGTAPCCKPAQPQHKKLPPDGYHHRHDQEHECRVRRQQFLHYHRRFHAGRRRKRHRSAK